jgi:ribonucleoside-diphosphate reductase alpha chain
LCQGQSLNFFFSADEEEEYISYVMQEAMLDPNVPAVYYNYGKRGVLASKGECEACQ